MGRILYLDETGITTNEETDPYLIVAGVLVHTDSQWRAVRDAIQKVADDWLPPADRHGFIFHAKDIYHGSRYWDRDVWPAEIRNAILADLHRITIALALPVFAQFIEKKNFGAGILDAEKLKYPRKAITIQGVCALDCIIWADRWLAQYVPNENATVTAEDKHDVREVIRAMHVVLKDQELMQKHELGEIEGLPLKRIVDGVSFQRKNEAVALQLADVCAFILKRGLCKLHLDPPDLHTTLLGQILLARHYTPEEVRMVLSKAAAKRVSAGATEKPV